MELLSAEDKIKDVSLLEEQYKGGGSDNTTPDYLHLYVLSSWHAQEGPLLIIFHTPRRFVWNIQENYILCDVYECEFKLVAEEKLLI